MREKTDLSFLADAWNRAVRRLGLLWQLGSGHRRLNLRSVSDPMQLPQPACLAVKTSAP